jgi:hypothetical protein
MVVCAVIADLFEAAQADERRHAEHEGQLAGVGEAGGDADQVLLADADVDVALGKRSVNPPMGPKSCEHRVALAEQEAVAPAPRRVLELQDVEERRRHEVGAGQRAAEMTVLHRGDRDDVAPQRRRAAAELIERGRLVCHRRLPRPISLPACT